MTPPAPPAYLIAIDPGVCTGYACFVGAELVRAGVCMQKADTFWRCIPRFERCAGPLEVWLELPVIYPGAPSAGKGNPGDLVTLAYQAGRLARDYEVSGAVVRTVAPSTWKGQVPKEIHHKRIRRILSAREVDIADLTFTPSTYAHNMWDAIGLGLYALGRKGKET